MACDHCEDAPSYRKLELERYRDEVGYWPNRPTEEEEDEVLKAKTTSEDCIRAIRAGADPADCFKRLLDDCPGSMAVTLWGIVQEELGTEATRAFEAGSYEILRCCDGCGKNVPARTMCLVGEIRLCEACEALTLVQR
jgi:hypothetical protein